MRSPKMTVVMLLAMIAAARTASADDSAALDAARNWYADMLLTGVRLAKAAPAPPQDALAAPAPPVVMAVFERWKACKWFASAKSKRFQSVGQLAICMAVLDQNGRYPVSSAATFIVVKLDEALASIGTRYKKSQRRKVVAQLERDAKGATIVRARAGTTEYVSTYMVLAPDGAIRAVWILEDQLELSPDSPSQLR